MIEFIDNEEFCRWNGVQMTEEEHWNLSKMLEFHNDLIQYYKKYEHDTIS